jgi:hypothetical protein
MYVEKNINPENICPERVGIQAHDIADHDDGGEIYCTYCGVIPE